jgi:cytochrome d ubiquinol oxidase subunit I
MVGIGLLMLAIVVIGNLLRAGERIYAQRLFLRVCRWSAPLGFLAVIAGWVTTEVGRQPWTVYGLLRTADSVSPSLTGWNVLASLAGYVIVYAVIFPSGGLVLARILRQGPSTLAPNDIVESGRPRSPVRPVPEASGEGGVG